MASLLSNLASKLCLTDLAPTSVSPVHVHWGSKSPKQQLDAPSSVPSNSQILKQAQNDHAIRSRADGRWSLGDAKTVAEKLP